MSGDGAPAPLGHVDRAPSPPASGPPRSRLARSLGGLREHAPSLTLLALGLGASFVAFFLLLSRAEDREAAAFNADAAPLVANLRSAFELPLEVLTATATLFEASRE